MIDQLSDYEPRVESLMSQGRELEGQSPEPAASQLGSSLHTLDTRWQRIMQAAKDREIKLEEAVRNADSFSADLNDFIMWVTDMEKTLNNLKPVSRILDTVNQQIEEHQVCNQKMIHQRFLSQYIFFVTHRSGYC